MKSILTTLVVLAPTAAAQQVATWGDLTDLLGDTVQEENFEGLSVHGGTSVVVPNPFNSGTTPVNWGVQPGVSYSSPGVLSIYGGFSGGDDNNFFRSSDVLLIEFDQAQAAVGINNFSVPGTTVTFSHGPDELGSVESDGSGFVGWQDALRGVTLVRVTPPGGSSLAVIDDVTWGFVVPPCPADVAPPAGVLDLGDINTYVQDFVDGEDEADIAPPAGVLDLVDLNLFIASFLAGCP